MSSISLYSSFRKKKHQAEEYFSEAPSTDYLLINIYTIREKKRNDEQE